LDAAGTQTLTALRVQLLGWLTGISVRAAAGAGLGIKLLWRVTHDIAMGFVSGNGTRRDGDHLEGTFL
jgi:hypothetical protein